MSAIIPVFNAEQTIERTIASVRSQTYGALEIVIVDDGSTDRTRQRVETCAAQDSRILLLRTPNQGVARARNTAIEAARGEFIAPIDADDLWHPTKIAKQVDAMLRAGTETAFVYTWARIIDANDGVVSAGTAQRLRGRVLGRHVVHNFVGNGSSMLFRRSVALELGGYAAWLQDLGIHGCEDLLLQLRMASRYTVEVVPEYLVGYRHGEAAMSADRRRMARSYMRALAEVQADPACSHVPAAAFNWGSAGFAIDAALGSARRGNYAHAMELSTAAMSRDPFGTLARVCARVVQRASRAGQSAPSRTRPFSDYAPDEAGNAERHWLVELRLRRMERVDLQSSAALELGSQHASCSDDASATSGAYLPWRVQHVHLDQALPELAAEKGSAGVYLVVWAAGKALGHLQIARAELPLSAERLRRQIVEGVELAREFEARANQPRPLTARLPSDAQPRLSVVICTRDRPDALTQCLDSLSEQRELPYEVVVVDNAPASEATADLVARRGCLRYVREPRPGLDCARNAGIRHARGDIVAFVDDDVTLHPDWSLHMRRAFVDHDVMAVTGLILAAELETAAQYRFERDIGFNRGYRARTYDRDFYERTRARGTPVWEIGAGANMAFRREIFARTGGFDERLDSGAAGVAGDSEFWYRVLAAGGCCRYEPSAVVFHRHRRELAQLERQLSQYMRGHVAALLVQFERYGDLGNLRRLVAGLPLHYARRVLRAGKRRQREEWRILATELAGCFAGLGYYLRTRDLASSCVPYDLVE